MKKAALTIVLIAILLFSLSGCAGKPFSFKEPNEDIVSVEIVSAESSLEYTVIKTLSETEKEEFLEQFETVEFRRCFGDPVSLGGNCIRLVYKSGIYVMTNSSTTEYVEDGKRYYLFISCDDNSFNDLLDKFLDEDET